MFIDLRKAFDTVDHALLISKLKRLGFSSHWSSDWRPYFISKSERNQLPKPMIRDTGRKNTSWLANTVGSVKYDWSASTLKLYSQSYATISHIVYFIIAKNTENSPIRDVHIITLNGWFKFIFSLLTKLYYILQYKRFLKSFLKYVIKRHEKGYFPPKVQHMHP